MAPPADEANEPAGSPARRSMPWVATLTGVLLAAAAGRPDEGAAGLGRQPGLPGVAPEELDVIAGEDVVDGVVLLHGAPRWSVPISRPPRYG
jgi:hypothetical protein